MSPADLSSPSLLRDHPAFAGINNRAAERLERQAESRRFRLGQPLCHDTLIPAEVLLIRSGTARLLWQDGGVLKTAEKLGPGSFVGLASLLRAMACEEVAAASELEALAIPDQLVLELLKQEPPFAAWAASQLFGAETLALVASLLGRRAQAGVPVLEAWRELHGQARLVPPSQAALRNWPVAVLVHAASNNLVDQPLGAQLDPAAGVPASRGPLPPRLIALPQAAAMALLTPVGESAPAQSEPSNAAPAPAPLASGLDLGQRDRPELLLLRGQGPLEETLACFQMLSAQLKLPVRRDAIEKILRDVLRRGQTPDLQLCGNIAAMMGLHVTGVQVPASQGNRLQVPAMVPWKEGFAVVRAADARGLVLASPRDGWVELSPAQIEATYPEGIEVLLVERSSSTPEQRFSFAWFWPALQRHRGILLQVLVASFVVQLFSLANPLLIQVIIDKVISQRSLDTLQVLGIALVVVTVLEGLIGALRTFLFTETTNRLDLRLGAEVIDHLLRLPLS